jgi:hypothetical protein
MVLPQEEEVMEASAPATLYVSHDGRTCVSGEAYEGKEREGDIDADSIETFDVDEFVLVRERVQADAKKAKEKVDEEEDVKKKVEAEETEVNAVIESAASKKSEEKDELETVAEEKDEGDKRIVVRVRMDLADNTTNSNKSKAIEVVEEEEEEEASILQHESDQLLMARQDSSFEIKEVKEETSPCARVTQEEEGGDKFGFRLLETKLTMSLGQLLLILLSNCVLTMFSYGFIMQCSYMSNSDKDFMLSSGRMGIEMNSVEVASVSGSSSMDTSSVYNDVTSSSNGLALAVAEDEYLRAHSLVKCKCICRPLLYSHQHQNGGNRNDHNNHPSHKSNGLDALAFTEEGNASSGGNTIWPALPGHQQYLVAWPTVRIDNYQGLNEMKCTIR